MRNFTLQGLMWIEEEGWIEEEKRIMEIHKEFPLFKMLRLRMYVFIREL